MNDLRPTTMVYIPSSGRPDVQDTYGLVSTMRATTIVVPEAEYEAYWEHHPNVLPHPHNRIHHTRQWILEHAARTGVKCCIMMDDDLDFAARGLGSTKLRRATPDDLRRMLRCLEDSIVYGGFVHAGITPRGGNNRVPDDYVKAHRMYRVLAYNTAAVLATGARFDRVPGREDFDMTLQLLRAGHENIVWALWAHTSGNNQAGGCSPWRTPEVMKQTAHQLADLHPGLVKPLWKAGKLYDGPGFEKGRWDVTIAWKKALATRAQTELL